MRRSGWGGYKIKALGAAWLCVEIHKYKLNYKKFNPNTNVQSDSAAGWLGGYEIKAISAVQLYLGILFLKINTIKYLEFTQYEYKCI